MGNFRGARAAQIEHPRSAMRSSIIASLFLHLVLVTLIGSAPSQRDQASVSGLKKTLIELTDPPVPTRPRQVQTPKRSEPRTKEHRKLSAVPVHVVSSEPVNTTSSEIASQGEMALHAGVAFAGGPIINRGKADPAKYRFEKRMLSGFKMEEPKARESHWTAEPTYKWVEKNVLARKCYFCHISKGPVLMFYDALMTIVVPGEPMESRLYEMGFVGKMPKGHEMTDEEKWAIYHWIKNGADQE